MALGAGTSMNFCSACMFNWPISSTRFASYERSKTRETVDTWLELWGVFILSTILLYRVMSAGIEQAGTSVLSLQQCSCSNTDPCAA